MIQNFRDLTNAAKHLVTKHGAEVGAVAKIAAHALIPGAPLLIGAVESLCDYAADKSQELTDESITEMIEGLGGDVQHLESLLGHLSGQLDGVVGQMSQMASFGTPPQALEAMVNSALESQFSTLRDELRALTPALETVKRQQETMLRQQNLQGDMLHQVQESLDAALAFNAPLAGEGVVGAQVSAFLGARGRFQSALLNGDFSRAHSALAEMKTISPNGNTTRVSEMALKAATKDFDGAERVARTIVGAGANQPRLQRARQSLTALTRARGGVQSRPSQPIPMTITPPTIEPGARIGDKGWQLDALIGRGGMGEVWRVTNLRGRAGALKLMSASLTEQAGFVERFQAEIDALEQVRHPAVVNVRDWGRVEGVGWYFVMPFVEGTSLRSRLRRGGLTSPVILKLIKTLAEGLSACHAEGIIHRDVKPDNILITADDQPILIDFGIAHQEGVNSGETQMATGGYAPPEQLAGRQVDSSVDLYALGVVWVECYGGWEKVPSEWLNLIERLTHNHPSRRGNASTLIAELSEAERRAEAVRLGEESRRAEAVRLGEESRRAEAARVAEESKRAEAARLAEDSRRAEAARLAEESKKAEVTRLAEESKRAEAVRQSSINLPSWQRTSLSFGGFLGFGKQRIECAVQTFNVTGLTFNMIRIPNKSYSMSQTQVTQALYRTVMGKNPSNFKGDDLPVERVSWEDGVAFCNALSEKLGLIPVYRGTSNDCQLIEGANGFRLPFEAEWRYAAKGGQNFKYAGSDNLDEVGWYSGNSGSKTHSVGQKKANGYGLYDMSGNVWEWCADDSSTPGQHRPGASLRANRGGSWLGSAVNCEVSNRIYYSPDLRDYTLGLRLSRSLD